MPRIHERRAVSGRGKDLRDFSSMDPIGKLEARRAMQDIAVPVCRQAKMDKLF